MNQPLETSQLRALVAIVDAGSLAGASRNCGLSRSTLRRHLAELEDQVGHPMVVTKSGKLLATSAGQHIVDGARPVLAAVANLAEEAKGVAGGLGRRMRIAFPAGVPPMLSAPFEFGLRATFPEPTEIIIAEDPLTLLAKGVDLAVLPAESIREGLWETFQISPSQHGLIASREYLEKHGHPTLEDLSSRAIGAWSQGEGIPNHLPLRDGGTLEFSPITVTNDSYRLWVQAASGLQLSMVPDSQLSIAELPNVVRVLPDLVGRVISVWGVVPTEMMFSKRLSAMLRKMRDAMAPHFPV